MVVTHLDLDEVRKHLAFSLAIPIPCICVSLIYMVIAYHCIYKERNKVCIEISAGLTSVISGEVTSLQIKTIL